MDRYSDVRYSFDPGRRRVWTAICEHLQRYVPPSGTLLELGAGYCDFVNQIRAARKLAIDRNPAMRAHCAPDVEFLCADTAALELPAASVDVVFASNFFEHLTDDARDGLLARLRSAYRPSATLILLQPNYYYCYRRYWDDFTHVKAYSHESLPDLLACRGYELVRVERRFLPFSFKGRLPKSYWLTKAYLALPWRPLAAQMLVVARWMGGDA